MAPPPYVRSIRIRNYKSIKDAEVEFGPITLLVGRNGSGKSNIVDAIHFVGDALDGSLDHAIRDRGGKDAIRRKSSGHPTDFHLDLALDLGDLGTARYGFTVKSRRGAGEFEVKREVLERTDRAGNSSRYDVRAGAVTSSTLEEFPKVSSDSLALVRLSGSEEFGPVYELLSSTGFYSLNPAAMKEIQAPDAGELLRSDGDNIASVIGRMPPQELERIGDYLSTIVPGISAVERITLGPRETLQFRQQIEGAEKPWKFYAQSMSDGTLRALGVLVALSQPASKRGRIPLIAVEEPEIALHPRAAHALLDAVIESSKHTQVVLTTHSPDLLDHDQLLPEWLRSVEALDGVTHVGELDRAAAKAMREELLSGGELLRQGQLSRQEPLAGQQQKSPFSDWSDED